MPQNLKPLTSLRFFAAFWVLLFDYRASLGIGTPAAIARGHLGVELFFVLSGFIICHVYLAAFGEGRFVYTSFLWTRLARIYPVHLATLVGFGGLAGAASLAGLSSGDRALIWSSLPAELTLTHAWGLAPLGGWNHPSWSISAEWFAYLLFPAYAFVAWRLRRRPVLALILAVGLVIGVETSFARLAGFPLSEATIAWGALRIIPCFALGSATYLAWRRAPIRAPALAVTASLASLAAIAAALESVAPDTLLIVLFAGLVFALAGLSSSGSRLLANPLAVYLGEVSFSLYMVAIPWQLVFEKGVLRLLHVAQPTPLPLWSGEIIGAIAAAIALHHLVELPARKAMRRHGPPLLRRGRLALIS